MPTNTPNLSLEKPLGSEKYAISKFNSNFDKIDEFSLNKMTYKGEVALLIDLPIVNQKMGDCYYVADQGVPYVWNGTEFKPQVEFPDIPEGGETAQTIGTLINSANLKDTPHDDDVIGYSDTQDITNPNILKKLTWANLKDSLHTFFEGLFAPSDSPTFTGIPIAPTATAGANTTQIATTEFVKSSVDGITKSSLGLGNVTNESKETMFSSPTFTGQVAYTPSTLATTGTVNIDFSGDAIRTQGDLTGAITYTGSNYGAGRTVTIRVKNGGTLRTLAFPAGWRFLGAKPANIAASKVGVLTVTSFSTDEADCVAAWAVEV